MIIGISGKIGSGKDTVGSIIQYFTSECSIKEGKHYRDYNTFINKRGHDFDHWYKSDWEIKKWADKLKDITCMLIGCTREQLEDHKFKNKSLGQEWWYFKITIYEHKIGDDIISDEKIVLIPYLDVKSFAEIRRKFGNRINIEEVIMSPRLFMQLLGTECGRQILHPNIWVNALMVDYKRDELPGTLMVGIEQMEALDKSLYPNWIITDTRFPNEAQAVKDRGGILVRVNRIGNYDDNNPIKGNQHESETALDNYEDWDVVINNDGSIEDLIKKVQEQIMPLL